MTDSDRPRGSSWHAWRRSADDRRHVDPEAPPAGPDAEPAAPLPSAAVEGAGEEGDDLSVRLEWPSAGSPEGERTAAPAEPTFELDDEQADDADGNGDAGAAAGGPGGGLDDDDDGDDDDDDDDDRAQLLPAVPLLPAIAGRVDTLHSAIATLAMRLDSLIAATTSLRTAVVDRVDDYAQTVAQLGRTQEQIVEDYRRGNERAVTELRRAGTDVEGLLHRMAARVDEVATDVSSALDQPRVIRTTTAPEGWSVEESSAPEVLAEVADLVASGNNRIADLIDVVAASQDDQGTKRQITEVRELLAVLVDSLPDSAEGSAALPDDVAEIRDAVRELRAQVAALAGRVQSGDFVVGEPVAPASLDDADLERLAEAVASRLQPPAPPAIELDLDALADRVVSRLERDFEVVGDEPPPAQPPPPPAAKGRGRKAK